MLLPKHFLSFSQWENENYMLIKTEFDLFLCMVVKASISRTKIVVRPNLDRKKSCCTELYKSLKKIIKLLPARSLSHNPFWCWQSDKVVYQMKYLIQYNDNYLANYDEVITVECHVAKFPTGPITMTVDLDPAHFR